MVPEGEVPQTQRRLIFTCCLRAALGQLISGNSSLLISVLISAGSQPLWEGWVTKQTTATAGGTPGCWAVQLSCRLLYLTSALRCLTQILPWAGTQQSISLTTLAVGGMEARQALGMDASPGPGCARGIWSSDQALETTDGFACCRLLAL